MSKITKEEATRRILKKVEKVNFREDRNIEFLGFKNDIWTNKYSVILIKCHIHNTITETKYTVFLKRDSWSCPKCHMEDMKNKRVLFHSQEEALAAIREKEKELKYIEFLGFIDETYRTTSKIKIYCKKHNYTTVIDFGNFISKGYMCPHCIGEHNSDSIKISNQEIFTRLNNKYSSEDYNFSYILNENELGAGVSRKITCICSKHGEFKRSYSMLMQDPGNIPCPQCKIEYNQKLKEDDARRKVEESIKKREEIGYHLRFVDFVGGSYQGCYTRLSLHCETHNTTWETSTWRGFTSGNNICGCPDCCGERNSRTWENICFEYLVNFGYIVKRQFQIKYIDPKKGIERKMEVDFHLPEKNVLIEYNGEQHYSFIPFLQDSIEDYMDQVQRDSILKIKAAELGMPLLVIPYTDKKRMKPILETFLETGKDISTQLQPKIYG